MENVKEKTRVISAVLKGIGWLEDNISALFLGSAILLLFYEVLARYFFNTAVYVSTEWTPVLVTWSMPVSYTHLDVYKRQEEYIYHNPYRRKGRVSAG